MSIVLKTPSIGILKNSPSNGVINNREGFSPKSYSNLSFWATAQDFSSITKDGGDFVSQWGDKSSFSNHATQITSINQPLYVASGINGNPALNFKGAGFDDWMHLPDNTISNDDYTIFGVFQLTAVAGSTSYLIGTNTPNRLYVLADSPSAFGIDKIKGVSGTTPDIVGSETADLNPHIVTQTKEGTSLKLKVDDNVEESTTTTATGAVTSLNIGSFNNGLNGLLEGYIGEIIMYNRALSSDERLVLQENYLSPQWGISV